MRQEQDIALQATADSPKTFHEENSLMLWHVGPQLLAATGDTVTARRRAAERENLAMVVYRYFRVF